VKRVVVIGCGALGSHCVQFMRNEDVSLRLIDFDRVEQTNVASQMHGKPNVGKLKVHSLQQTMNFLFGTKLEVVPHKLTTDNEAQLLGGADLLIDCLDNAASRRIVQGFAARTGTPCLHGALDGAGTCGRVVWDPAFRIDEEGTAGAATCEDGAFLPFIALTASYLARSAQIFLLEGKKVGFEISPRGAFST
jgi:molybdopterin-synthase adenylyltransferase